MEDCFITVASGVGPWTVQGATSGISRVFMPHESVPSESTRSCDVVTRAARQLEEYFAGSRTEFDVVLSPREATAFQRQVWHALQSVPYGSIATYAQVATLVGRPQAARAVGNANHANPWPIFVPCHRVVSRHGLGGYGGGEDVKRFLLTLEGASQLV